MKRDFHKEVRVVYRACRKLYGIEKTQDECLKVFKVVFPELYRLRNSEDELSTVPIDVRNKLYEIANQWKATGKLAELIEKAGNWIDLPMECERKELIQFYEDIMPVVMRIRKLTPKECFRLMGVSEEDIDTMLNSGISNSSAYKLAGNSIVVDVLYHLFRKAYIETDQDIVKGSPVQLSLF